MNYLSLRLAFPLMSIIIAMAMPLSADAASNETNPQPHIEAPYAYATTAMQKNGAAFMTIAFPEAIKTSGDILVSVSGEDIAESIELHTHSMDNGVMKMRKAENGFAATEHAIALQPAGDHIMLMGLKAPLIKGQTVHLTLHFAKAGDINVAVPVLGAGEKPEGISAAQPHSTMNEEGHHGAGHSHH